MIDTKAIRTKLLDLAIQGKLTEQKAEDGTSFELYEALQKSRTELEKKGVIKKRKPLDEIKEKEKTIPIPVSWKWVRLGELIVSISGGKSFKCLESMPDDNQMGVVKVSAVTWGAFQQNESKTCLSADMWNEDYRIKSGDFLISRSNTDEFVGNCVIVEDITKRLMLSDKILRIEYLAGIDKWYILYAMRTRFIREQIISIATGTSASMKNISRDGICSLLIPLPPIKEQARIVEKLSKIKDILTKIDDDQIQYAKDTETLKAKLIEAGLRGKLTEQLPEEGTAEELYQQIQAEKQRLVKAKKIKKEQPLPPIETKDIPFPIPTNWKWVRLGDIARKIASGNTPTGGRNSDVYAQSGYCLFREQNIYNDGIHEEGMVYITEELLATRENSTVYAGDILLNITGGSIGRCAVVPDSFDRGSVNQHILIIRMIDERLRHYIHKVICSPYAQKYINQKAFGDKGGFSGTRCKMMPIPLPPLEEQKRIVERIDSIYASI